VIRKKVLKNVVVNDVFWWVCLNNDEESGCVHIAPYVETEVWILLLYVLELYEILTLVKLTTLCLLTYKGFEWAIITRAVKLY
jgi:hypothetical protein